MPTPILVTVTGHIAGAGTVVFTRHRALISSADDTIIPPGVDTAVLDENGDFTVELYATNDPDWLPTGWAYSVRVNAGGGVRGSLELDYQTTAVDFDDVLQVAVSPSAGQTYVPFSQLGVALGVATLGADGVLSAAQRPDQAVDSVNGSTGVVMLDAADVGADPAGAAAAAVAALTSADLGIYVGPAEPVGAVDGDIWFDTSGA